MEWYSSFRPQGPITLIPAKPGPTNAATNIGGPTAGDVAFLGINPSGSPDVFLFYGPSSTLVSGATVPAIPSAATQQVIPPAGCGVFHMPAGSIQVFTLTGATPFVNPVTSGLGSCTISLTPGAGV